MFFIERYMPASRHCVLSALSGLIVAAALTDVAEVSNDMSTGAWVFPPAASRGYTKVHEKLVLGSGFTVDLITLPVER